MGSPTCVFFLDVLSKIFPVGRLIITKVAINPHTFVLYFHVDSHVALRLRLKRASLTLAFVDAWWMNSVVIHHVTCKLKFSTQTFRPPSSPAPPPDPSAQQAWHQASSLQQHFLEKPQHFPFDRRLIFAQILFTFNIFIVFVVNVNVDVNPKHLGCFKHLQRVVSRVA